MSCYERCSGCGLYIPPSGCIPVYTRSDDPYYQDPPILPIDLEELKDYLKIIGDDEDSRLTSLILTVAQGVECTFNVVLVPTIFEKKQTWFSGCCDKTINLERRPVTSVLSVSYVDHDDQFIGIDEEAYRLLIDHRGFAQIIFNDKLDTSDIKNDYFNIVTRFEAGYEVGKLPYVIKNYIMWAVGVMYFKSPECGETSCNNSGLPCGVEFETMKNCLTSSVDHFEIV